MLSDDDLNLRDLSDEELARAWDLWFDLAQTTNDDDPLYTHGVLVDIGRTAVAADRAAAANTELEIKVDEITSH